jgi:hypothetical protein
VKCLRLRVFALICACVAALPAAGFCSALLSPDDLKTIKPQYELFLGAAAELLVQKGLLDVSDRSDWIDFQLADYIRNGGYGTIEIMYNPDILASVEEDEMALRISADIQTGSLKLDTLRAFNQGASSLPGLPLDAALITADGEPVECAFRWSATGGMFLIWDSYSSSPISMGASIISGGELVYWSDDPAGSERETLTIEFVSLDSNETFGAYSLELISDGARWSVGEDAR